MPRVIHRLVEARNSMNIADPSICLESETASLFQEAIHPNPCSIL